MKPFLCLLVLAQPGCTAAIRAPLSQVTRPAKGQIAQAAQIDSLIKSSLALRNIPGAAVAVLRHDTLVYARGFGVADRTTGIPVTDATIFQIASLTKPFTAMAVLMLVEEGRIQLDARAARYITWLPAKYQSVTIRQLLTHTSGVTPDLRRENVDEFDIEEFKRRLAARDPSFAPGTKVQYANTGFTLLSLVVEAASGEEFGVFLQRRIFGPLGMNQTGYRVPQRDDGLHARGYELVNGQLVDAPHIFSGWGNSGIETNVLDLAKFAAALDRRALLRSSTYDLMYTPGRLANDSVPKFTSNGVPTQFGLSWFLQTYRGVALVSHGGALAGFSSELDRYIQKGWTVIVLSNGKQGADRAGQAQTIAQKVADVILFSETRLQTTSEPQPPSR